MDVFEALPVIVLLLYIFKKVFDKIGNLDWEGEKGEFSFEPDFKKGKQQKKYGQQKPGWIITDSEEETTEETLTDSGIEKTQKKQQQSKRSASPGEITFPNLREKRRKETSRDFSSEKSSTTIFAGQITGNDLIKGIIFKEILDKPRSKKPYLPPQQR